MVFASLRIHFLKKNKKRVFKPLNEFSSSRQELPKKKLSLIGLLTSGS